MDKRTVLVAEDDEQIATVLNDYFVREGFIVDRVANGDDTLARLRTAPPCVLVLDLMLPGQDGLQVCTELRRFSSLPVLMLTARTDEEDRVAGLEAGADDYVCKPFSPREVVARVRALLRRAGEGVIAAQVPSGFVVGLLTDRIRWHDVSLPFTQVEDRLFRVLYACPGRVFTREALLAVLHDQFRDVSDRTVDTHIKNMRRKLRAHVDGREVIRSMYGVGYFFEQ